ncbi:MAG: DUF3147 family protein [Planctomycetota bacterium]
MHPALKIFITAALIVLITEVSNRTGYLGGLLASLPLISYLSIVWLYVEGDDKAKATEIIGQHSISVFWFVLPTLPFFVLLPVLLKHMHFAAAMALGTVFMLGCYAGTMWAVSQFGIKVV